MTGGIDFDEIVLLILEIFQKSLILFLPGGIEYLKLLNNLNKRAKQDLLEKRYIWNNKILITLGQKRKQKGPSDGCPRPSICDGLESGQVFCVRRETKVGGRRKANTLSQLAENLNFINL